MSFSLYKVPPNLHIACSPGVSPALDEQQDEEGRSKLTTLLVGRWFVFDPKLADPHPESAKTYPQKVHCSVYNRDAAVIVANWSISEEGWGGWRVIDCSLLPPGAVHCGMDCLSQARIKQE